MENHHITIDNRERITVRQVADVDAFDEAVLWANLKEGSLEITGEKLNMGKLDLEAGLLVVTGRIHSVEYTDKKMKSSKPFLQRFGRK